MTEHPADITTNTATLAGKINTNGLQTNVSFEYGTTTNYGQAAPALQSPVASGANIVVNALVTGLTKNTLYHYRVKAQNVLGITYGIDVTFTTPEPDGTTGTVTDVEGNIYKTIVIGSKTWMAENLRTTKYNDGISIPNVVSGIEWSELTTPAYCWYGNDEANFKVPYGALYNWFAVNAGKLAPSGWHVATAAEWTTLINFLGGENSAGGKMKEVGYAHWFGPNSGATNSSGFTALPGGMRLNSAGGYTFEKERGAWWTASPSATEAYAIYHVLDHNLERIDNTYYVLNYKVDGFSVRCVKD